MTNAMIGAASRRIKQLSHDKIAKRKGLYERQRVLEREFYKSAVPIIDAFALSGVYDQDRTSSLIGIDMHDALGRRAVNEELAGVPFSAQEYIQMLRNSASRYIDGSSHIDGSFHQAEVARELLKRLDEAERTEK